MNDELGALILGERPKTAAPAAPAPMPAAPAPASDELGALILGRQPAPAARMPAPGTPAQEQGRADLRMTIQQMRERLADTIPGSQTHRRLTSDIAAAERELGMAPAAAPAAAPAPTEAAPAEPSGVMSVARKLFGGLEAGGTMVGGIVSSVPAGLAGLYKLATTGSPEQAAEAVKSTQAAIMQPLTAGMTPEGQRYAEALGKGMEVLNIPAQRIGEATLTLTGSPAAATAGEIVLNPLNLLGVAGPARAAMRGRMAAAPGAVVTPEAAALPGGARVLTPEQVTAAQTVPTVAERIARAETGMAPAVPGAVAPAAAPAAGAAAVPAAVAGTAAAGQPAPFGSVGAAATTRGTTLDAAIAMATPELRTELEAVKKAGGRINRVALDRQLEADSLPVPVRLTEGQATGDIVKISDEFNKRGQPGGEAIAYRLKEQNDRLLQNINAIRDAAAPNVYGTNVVENGQALINTYKALDEARNVQIRGLYKQLEDAAGGQFPVDGKAFVADADRLLSKKLKSEFVPPSIRRQMDRFKEGEQMTFEQFEALRTNLAAEIRKAERTGDGNAEMAASLVRQSLENLPMKGADAVRLKSLADQARVAARDRFQMLEKDPAYKAAVNDKVAPDDFINRFVISGKKQNIEQMVQQFGRGSDAHQVMAAGTINWLRSKAGLVGEAEGNFSQAGYNKALQTLEPRLLDIMDAEHANQLRTLGNVARYTQEKRTGSFPGTSSTATALLRAGVGKAVGAAEQAIPVVGPLVGMGREALAKRAAQQEIADMLKTGAGVQAPKKGKKVKDIAQEGQP